MSAGTLAPVPGLFKIRSAMLVRISPYTLGCYIMPVVVSGLRRFF